MRTTSLSSVIALLSSSTLATLQGYSPFSDPFANPDTHPFLAKRQTCEEGYNSCALLGSDSACCPPGTNCELDQAGNVACCSQSWVCTGTIGVTATATSLTSNYLLGGTTATTTGPYLTTSPATTYVAGGGSTVPGPYPFIYNPTSYANAALCSSYWTACQSQSAACLVSLAGSNGITVSGLGYGVTQQGASGTALSAASSICSALSTSACYGLQVNQCSGYGGGLLASNAAPGPRQTGCAGMMYAAGAGAIAGAVGALV